MNKRGPVPEIDEEGDKKEEIYEMEEMKMLVEKTNVRESSKIQSGFHTI